MWRTLTVMDLSGRILRCGPATGDHANGRVKAAQFQDLSQGDGYVGNIYGTWEGTGASYPVGGHGLIVGRITWARTRRNPIPSRSSNPTPTWSCRPHPFRC